MNSEKPKLRRRQIFRRRARRLRTVAMLPSMITLINGICGFVAIGLTAQGSKYYNMAAYFIFYAMIADVLDGRVARMSKTTSSFGGQLDSLCDMVSFGAAPAFMLFSILLLHREQLIGSVELLLGDFFERFVWVTAIAYLSCAAIRLARFNVENVEDESAHMAFTGLPSPAAAGVVASVVMFSRHLVSDPAFETAVFKGIYLGLLYALPFVTLACGLLMVSRIRYLHLFNYLFRGKKSVNYLFLALFVVGMIWLCGLPLSLLLAFSTFAFSGPVRWAWRKVRRAKTVPATAHDESTLDLTNPADNLL